MFSETSKISPTTSVKVSPTTSVKVSPTTSVVKKGTSLKPIKTDNYTQRDTATEGTKLSVFPMKESKVASLPKAFSAPRAVTLPPKETMTDEAKVKAVSAVKQSNTVSDVKQVPKTAPRANLLPQSQYQSRVQPAGPAGGRKRSFSYDC